MDELIRCLEKQRIDMRTMILGEDGMITSSGFRDTPNGCVVTSVRPMELVIQKSEEDKWKRVPAKAEGAERKLNDIQRMRE